MQKSEFRFQFWIVVESGAYLNDPPEKYFLTANKQPFKDKQTNKQTKQKEIKVKEMVISNNLKHRLLTGGPWEG